MKWLEKREHRVIVADGLITFVLWFAITFAVLALDVDPGWKTVAFVFPLGMLTNVVTRRILRRLT